MKNIKKLLAKILVCTILVGFGVSTKALATTGWYSQNNGWYYLIDNTVKTGWLQISDNWYYFDSYGKMQTGWVSSSGKWYYLNTNGAMATSKWIGNYYVTGDGSMATNAWIGDYYVGNDGAWIANYINSTSNEINVDSSQGISMRNFSNRIVESLFKPFSNGVISNDDYIRFAIFNNMRNNEENIKYSNSKGYISKEVLENTIYNYFDVNTINHKSVNWDNYKINYSNNYYDFGGITIMIWHMCTLDKIINNSDNTFTLSGQSYSFNPDFISVPFNNHADFEKISNSQIKSYISSEPNSYTKVQDFKLTIKSTSNGFKVLKYE